MKTHMMQLVRNFNSMLYQMSCPAEMMKLLKSSSTLNKELKTMVRALLFTFQVCQVLVKQLQLCKLFLASRKSLNFLSYISMQCSCQTQIWYIQLSMSPLLVEELIQQQQHFSWMSFLRKRTKKTFCSHS